MFYSQFKFFGKRNDVTLINEWCKILSPFFFNRIQIIQFRNSEVHYKIFTDHFEGVTKKRLLSIASQGSHFLGPLSQFIYLPFIGKSHKFLKLCKKEIGACIGFQILLNFNEISI